MRCKQLTILGNQTWQWAMRMPELNGGLNAKVISKRQNHEHLAHLGTIPTLSFEFLLLEFRDTRGVGGHKI